MSQVWIVILAKLRMAGHGSRNCSKHCGAEVVRSYVCDDWRSEGGEDR